VEDDLRKLNVGEKRQWIGQNGEKCEAAKVLQELWSHGVVVVY
jgi:hypothetical protein